jgi:hypothetical protein
MFFERLPRFVWLVEAYNGAKYNNFPCSIENYRRKHLQNFPRRRTGKDYLNVCA